MWPSSSVSAIYSHPHSASQCCPADHPQRQHRLSILLRWNGWLFHLFSFSNRKPPSSINHSIINNKQVSVYSHHPWQRLYFFPLPHGHNSLRSIFFDQFTNHLCIRSSVGKFCLHCFFLFIHKFLLSCKIRYII